jgi:hypothetical protein
MVTCTTACSFDLQSQKKRPNDGSVFCMTTSTPNAHSVVDKSARFNLLPHNVIIFFNCYFLSHLLLHPIRDIAVRLVPQLFSMTFEHLISLKSCLRAFSMNIGQSVSESVDSDFFFVWCSFRFQISFSWSSYKAYSSPFNWSVKHYPWRVSACPYPKL